MEIRKKMVDDHSHELSELIMDIVKIFKREDPKGYEEIIKAFNGKSADVALLGQGKFHISIQENEIKIVPGIIRGETSTGRGAIAPETLNLIFEGKLTPLEAFFKGDLIARSNSEDLHKVYNTFVKYSKVILKTKEYTELIERFMGICKI